MKCSKNGFLFGLFGLFFSGCCYVGLFFSFKFCEHLFGHVKINIVQINIFLQTIQSGQFAGFILTVIYHSINFCCLRSEWFGFFRVFYIHVKFF